jgi:hypothetical protein
MTASEIHNKFESTEKGIFRFIRGPANSPGQPSPCQWKLCITATDEDYLVATLYKISQREDCFFVKYSPAKSPKSRDGMMLGRVFLTSKEQVGKLWRELYSDRKLMCSIQDDEATEKYRSSKND